MARADPSRATRAELTVRATECVTTLGALSRAVGKASSSPALQSTINSFAEYEPTITSTQEMLRKIHQGLIDLDNAVEDCARAVRAPGGDSTNER